MVFFVCDECGETLRKKQVLKHNLLCPTAARYSCMDCQRVFDQHSYTKHTKCITEDQKYGGANHVPTVNKDEQKQDEWVRRQVRAAIRLVDEPQLKKLLRTIRSQTNIPRKKSKFVRFLQNSLGEKNRERCVEAWNAIKRAADAREHRESKKQQSDNERDSVDSALPKKKVAKIGSKMPMINWTVFGPNQVKGTVFNNMNVEKPAEVLDLTMSKLELMFSLEEKKQPSSAVANCGKNTLLSNKRLQNIAIFRRTIGKSAPQLSQIMTAVHQFDFSVLTSDEVDVLLSIIPTVDEITKLQEFAKHNNGNFESLTAEDQFLAKLMDIERLERKLTLMKFMSDFVDNARLLISVLQKVTVASKSIQNAQKLPKVLGLILAIGNAINGERMPLTYRFKIESLDLLTILKSPKDRNCTLMHILAEIMTDKLPKLLDFTTELKLVDYAASANFETIVAEVKEIDAKFEQVLSEQKRRGKDESPESLNAFIELSSAQLISLKENFELAQQSFLECSQYYGEDSSAVPDVFFTRIASFCKHFETALSELKARKASEKRQQRR